MVWKTMVLEDKLAMNVVIIKYQGPAKDHTFVRLDKGWLVASYDWFPTFSIEQLLPSPRYLTSYSNS